MSLATTTEHTSLGDLCVADAMHAGVLTCSLATPLRLVAQMMVTHRIHCVVVYEGDGGLPGTDSLWGVVSDLDLVAAAITQDLDERTAGATAASPVVMVPPTETLERAAQLMQEYGTAHLVVVDPESVQPVGVLSTLDIARLLS
jgi:CBS domain-containing protein